MSDMGDGPLRHGVWHEFSFRALIGYLLLAWGVILAVHGLGLATTQAGQFVQLYWPLPIIAWALFGLVYRLVTSSGGGLVYLLVLLLAALVQLSALHIGHFDAGTIFWAIVVIAFAFEVLRGPNWRREWQRDWQRGWQREWRRDWRRGRHWRYGIGDVDVTVDANQSRRLLHEGHLIGDIRLDLSQIHLEDGETPFELNALIGDITVLVPADLPVSVVAEVTVGDIRIFRQSADGIGRRLTYETPGYDTATRKVRIMAHLLIGDITVQQF